MSASAADFIAASGFTVRDDVAKDATIINITNPKQSAVPTPPTTISGSRIKITSGTKTDYYKITNAVIGRIVAGGMDWANVTVVPTAEQAYKAGDSVSFEPYAAAKNPFPTFTVKEHQHLAVALLNYFEMVGGKDSDLSFTAHPGGAQAQFTIHGTTLRIDGRTRGAVSCVVSARDRAQGVVTQTLAVVVAHENRRPTSVKALGDPTIGVGATAVYDLDDYFSDPDGDVLAYTVSGENQNVTATFVGNQMTVSALGQDSVDLLVDATDPDGLDVSQQMTVTVPQNRRPVRIQHVDPVNLAIGGDRQQRGIDRYFTDPDGGRLLWLAQWEEGDPAKQYRQEFWSVNSKTGTNLLALQSRFRYPTSVPPWGTGAPWKVPAGTDFVWRNGTPVVRTTGTLLSEATATWDASADRVKLNIRSATALAPTFGAPSRVQLGVDADVAWIETDRRRKFMYFDPGDAPGARTAYVKVWDTGNLFASDLFPVGLGRGPVGTLDVPISMFTGEDKEVPLGDVFTDPDGDKLTYSIWNLDSIPPLTPDGRSKIPLSIAKPVIRGDVLVVHGLTPGVSFIELRAVDPLGFEGSGTVIATVQESAVASLPPLISLPFYTDRLTALIKNEGAPAIATLLISGDAPFPRDSFRITNEDWIYPTGSTSSSEDDSGGNTIRLSAFFGAGDPPAWDSGTDWQLPITVSRGWRVIPEFKAPQNPGFYSNRDDPSYGVDWSLLPVPIAGDRFYFDGHEAVIATVVSIDFGEVRRIRQSFGTAWVIVFDLTLDVDETAWGQGWTFSAADPIVWLPRTSTKTASVGVLPRDRLPRDFSSITAYLESEVVVIDAAAGFDLTTPGVIITLENDDFLVTKASRRYYRGTPLFWEVLLQPRT